MPRTLSAEQAAQEIKSSDHFGSGLGPAWPPALMAALGARTDWQDLTVDGALCTVGTELFTKGIFAFELATALLIVAVIGAIAVARGRQGAVRPKKVVCSPRDLFAGPVHPRDAGRPLGSEGAE